MVLASFQVEDNLEKARFFQETLLLANTNMKVILDILSMTLNNRDVQFVKKELIWRLYTLTKTLPTTKQLEIIDKKEFAKAIIEQNIEIFVVYVTSLYLGQITIHLA